MRANRGLFWLVCVGTYHIYDARGNRPFVSTDYDTTYKYLSRAGVRAWHCQCCSTVLGISRHSPSPGASGCVPYAQQLPELVLVDLHTLDVSSTCLHSTRAVRIIRAFKEGPEGPGPAESIPMKCRMPLWNLVCHEANPESASMKF